MESNDRSGRPIAAENDVPLDELVFECLERGESEGDGALEDMCRAHPALATALRERVTALRESGLLPWVPGNEGVPSELGGYRLTKWLGGGASGLLFRARRESDGRSARIRVAPHALLRAPGARARATTALARAAALSHPAIVAIESHGDERGCIFAVSRATAPTPLRDVLARIGTRSPETLRGVDWWSGRRERAAPQRASDSAFSGAWIEACLSIARDVGRALAFAHSAGIAHGTVDTNSIGIDGVGNIAVSDFGWSEIHGRAPKLAVPEYKSPERREGRTPEPSVSDDVFALGAVLHETLTLRLPLLRPRTLATWLSGTHGIEPPSRRNSLIGEPLERVLAIALHDDSRKRYASMGEMILDLESLLSGRGLSPQSRARGRWWRVDV